MKLTDHLAKVRDMCLIGAGTGQRYSDFSCYTQDQFSITVRGVHLLKVISTKTDMPAKIPLTLFPWLLPILEKHDFRTPKLSMQKFNTGIKELARVAGVDESVLLVEQYIGRRGRVESFYKKKYEVASHICRRTFATNLYRRGISLVQIMPMTGHTTESMLAEYIGIDAELNAEFLALEPTFHT